jgi:hypothetical protein
MAESSLTISFNTTTGSSDQFIDLELDDDLNDDKSSFLFGDTVYFKVFTNCSTVDFYLSEGSIINVGSGTDDVTEIITFSEPPESAGGVASDNTASLSYPAKDGTFSATKIGSGTGCGTITVDSVDSKQVNASLAGPGAYIVTYKSDYLSKKITGPNMPYEWDTDESYPVVVVAVGS